MTYKVEDIANKILAKATNSDAGSLISNMKLQKMLYYMQGYHLAYFNNPLFDEEIEAWMYGPVVPSVYDKYKEYENRGISYTGDTIHLNDEEEQLFEEVYELYDEYSAIGLMKLTHSEEPWKKTATGVGNIIPKKLMQNFFKNYLE